MLSKKLVCSVLDLVRYSSTGPNLAFRKAKLAKKTVEQYVTAKIPIPKLQGLPLYGVFPVLECLSARKRKVHRLFIKDSVRIRALEDQRIAEIIALATAQEIPQNRLTGAQLDRITEYQLHNGICLDADELPPMKLNKAAKLTVFLAGVLDPGNIGAIARSALFFGVDQIVYDQGPSQVTAAMSKASSGALERITVCRIDDFRDTFELTDAKFIATCDPMAAKELGKPTIDLTDLADTLAKDDKIVIVLGDEGRGIPSNIIQSCDLTLSLSGVPITTSVSSLNVSVTAGILLQRLHEICGRH